eukprot:4003557-Pleurochrysis_carterae.AAC.1
MSAIYAGVTAGRVNNVPDADFLRNKVDRSFWRATISAFPGMNLAVNVVVMEVRLEPNEKRTASNAWRANSIMRKRYVMHQNEGHAWQQVGCAHRFGRR